jgi:non-specific serine/threonine protein kinase
MESASDVADRFVDDVKLIELASLNDECDVVSALGAAFGIRSEQRNDWTAVTELLCERLSRRNLLLVFDNCEHVIQVVARIATDILRNCGDVTILATSREPLSAYRAKSYMPSLPFSCPLGAGSPADFLEAEAVLLFCDRARESRPTLSRHRLIWIPSYASAVDSRASRWPSS